MNNHQRVLRAQFFDICFQINERKEKKLPGPNGHAKHSPFEAALVMKYKECLSAGIEEELLENILLHFCLEKPDIGSIERAP